jgi:hypothetical protein
LPVAGPVIPIQITVSTVLGSTLKLIDGDAGTVPPSRVSYLNDGHCRKCYVHPEVLNSYMDGNLVLELKSKAESELRGDVQNLKPEEAAVLALLRGRLTREGEQAKQTVKAA